MNNVILSKTPVQKLSKLWEEKISSIPTKHLFENGTHRPIMMDIMFADKEFAPQHKDEPEKNGVKYRIAKEAIEAYGKQFVGTPVYLYDRAKADHGFGESSRKSIGFIHEVILNEDGRGLFLQALGGVMPLDTNMSDLEDNQTEIGVSPEFSIDNTSVQTDGSIIKFLPRGVLILDRQNAAFKDSQLYCSDATIKNNGGENPVTETTNQKQSGGVHMFCEKCAPLADNEIQKLAASKIKDFEDKMKQLKTVEDIKAQTELAAAQAKSDTEKLSKEIEALKAALAEKEAKISEHNRQTLEFLAAADVNAQFEARKADYPQAKHDDVKRTLLKIKLGQATPAEVLALADWKVVAKGNETTTMQIAGSPTPGGAIKSDADIDRILGLDKLYGYKGKK